MDKISGVISRKSNRAVFPLVCADHGAWLTHNNFAKVATNPEKLAEVTAFAHQIYGYDMVLLFSDAYVEAQALGCPVRLSPFPVLTGSKSENGFDRTDVIIEAARILKTRLKVPLFVSIKGIFSLASFLAGITEFLKMIIKEPDTAQSFLDQALEFQLSYVARLLDLGVHIFIGDPVASASIISPDKFAQFAYNPLKSLITKIKKSGSYVGIHICGDTCPIMQQLDSLGADILSVEDITPKTKTLKMGGVKTSTILYGNQTAISEEIRATANEPFIILSTTCDVPIETPPGNLIHMVNYLYDPSND